MATLAGASGDAPDSFRPPDLGPRRPFGGPPGSTPPHETHIDDEETPDKDNSGKRVRGCGNERKRGRARTSDKAKGSERPYRGKYSIPRLEEETRARTEKFARESEQFEAKFRQAVHHRFAAISGYMAQNPDAGPSKVLAASLPYVTAHGYRAMEPWIGEATAAMEQHIAQQGQEGYQSARNPADVGYQTLMVGNGNQLESRTQASNATCSPQTLRTTSNWQGLHSRPPNMNNQSDSLKSISNDHVITSPARRTLGPSERIVAPELLYQDYPPSSTFRILTDAAGLRRKCTADKSPIQCLSQTTMPLPPFEAYDGTLRDSNHSLRIPLQSSFNNSPLRRPIFASSPLPSSARASDGGDVLLDERSQRLSNYSSISPFRMPAGAAEACNYRGSGIHSSHASSSNLSIVSNNPEQKRRDNAPFAAFLAVPRSHVSILRSSQQGPQQAMFLDDEDPEERRSRNSKTELFPQHNIRKGKHKSSSLSGFSTLSTSIPIESLLTDPQNRVDNRGDGEVTRMGAGESYRPSARPRSPRADAFRSDRGRSPRRDRARTPQRERARTPPPSSDSYHPGGRDRSPRRRSRTPPYKRERTPPRDVSNWRTRPRSPARQRSSPRRFSPRRDENRRERHRSPKRDERRRSRSPYDRDRATPRARSPLPSRRSPPAGPRGSWRPRSRSPDRRDDRVSTGPSSSTWRRRSPSTAARESERSSDRTSGNTSRRSSPHAHASRVPFSQSASRDTRARSPPTRDRSPLTQSLSLTYRDRESARSTPREPSPARPAAPRSPPRGPSGFKPPTGPSSNRNFTAPAQSPSVSSGSTPISMSAHNRHENTGPIVPPAGPRGYMQSTRGSSYLRGGRGSFGTDRHSRSDTTSWGAAPLNRSAAESSTRGNTPVIRPALSPSQSAVPGSSSSSVPNGPSGIPTGPRAGPGIPSRPSLQHSSSVYSRVQQSNAASPVPRVHPAIANLPQIIPGGRIDPTASGISADIALRLKKKEEEAEILREELKQKQEKLRRGLKTWDKLSRDSASMGLRSELSERHVRMLAGEGVGGAAF